MPNELFYMIRDVLLDMDWNEFKEDCERYRRSREFWGF